jgi:hypothetical protein
MLPAREPQPPDPAPRDPQPSPIILTPAAPSPGQREAWDRLWRRLLAETPAALSSEEEQWRISNGI